ncbi:MAG: UTP--glucose-1-phosphate uridylyltransferase GalU [Bdellovibrionales bacterium]|nr:UTP--glucose-1-phosphate uridylyltransferase GalU [Bdellovibrionales bacterium]
MKIRKAVIPVAGLGTRFLPATKTVPKELLPIVDKPTLLYIVEEIVAAGLSEIVLIAGRGKTAIEDFFDTSYELEATLEKAGRLELLKPFHETVKNLTVVSIRQHVALGLGHAVLCAEPAIGREPFAVLLGDEVMIRRPGKPSGIAQLTKIYEETGVSTVAVMPVEESEVNKYGMVKVTERAENLWNVHDVVEKPALGQAPSRFALPGRYVFDASIFEDLRQTKPGRGGEIQLTDAMTSLAKRQGLLATVIDAQRFDAGDKLGYLQANIELGLSHPQIGPALEKYLKERFGGK